MSDKVNLDLLKKLILELESSLTSAYSIKEDAKSDKNEFVVEMFKAVGLTAGIMTEAGLLIGDIQVLTSASTVSPSNKKDFLDKIIAGFKSPGNIN